MKKNITINLCGRLFQIDEDAYEMLQHYIDSLRSHFRRQEGGDEIVNDIEERIAELFNELKSAGNEAITIDHVKDIITRIGKPEELAGEEGEHTNDSWQDSARSAAQDIYNNVRTRTAGKKLYRNPKDKMLAGVLSGFAAYTNTDVAFWRIGTALITLFTGLGVGIVVYLVLAIVLPQANTPEDQLHMQGKEVNPQNLASAVVDDKQTPQVQRSGFAEVFSVFLKIVFGFFIGIAILVGSVFGIAFLAVLMTVLFALIMPAKAAVTLPFTLGGMGLVEVWSYHPAMLIGFAVALLAVLFIPVYAIVHMLLSVSKKVKPMSTVQRVVWIVLWIIAMCCLIPLGSSIGMLHQQYDFNRQAEIGQWMTDVDRAYLNANGWKLELNANCGNDYVKSGEYFTGDIETAYLDVWNANAEQVFQVRSQEQVVDSGTYRITCNARAEGEGVFIYAKTPANKHQPAAQVMIPAYGNKGGKIWEEAGQMLKIDTLSLPEKQRYKDIYEANDGQGYGWSEVEMIVKVDRPRTTLSYGVSTWEETTKTSNNATWFSACDFKVEKIK